MTAEFPMKKENFWGMSCYLTFFKQICTNSTQITPESGTFVAKIFQFFIDFSKMSQYFEFSFGAID